MAQILTKTFRTKTEAREAIKKGEVLFVQSTTTGKVYDQMNGGPIAITGKLDHYKEWSGDVWCDNGKVVRIR